MEVHGNKSLVIRELFKLHRDWRPSELRDELARLYPGYTVTLPTINAALASLRAEEADGDEGTFADTLRPVGAPPGPERPPLAAVEAGLRPKAAAPAERVTAAPAPAPAGLRGVQKLVAVHRWLRRAGVAPAAVLGLLELEPDGAELRGLLEALAELRSEEVKS